MSKGRDRKEKREDCETVLHIHYTFSTSFRWELSQLAGGFGLLYLLSTMHPPTAC